jgi:carbamate kinase
VGALPPSILIALGGNAIVRPGERGTIEQQIARTRETMARIAALVGDASPRLVITHGNGPQVGDVLLRGELAKTDMGPIPLDVAVADTQGGMGYMIATSLRDALEARSIRREVAAVVTTVTCDPGDPAFAAPSKPVGAFYPSLALARRPGWVVKEFPPRGFRRVVPSPRPIDVLEKRVVRSLYDAGVIVVAAGGGGVPVVREKNGRLRGVEAVVDKDLTSAILASNLGVDTFAVATGVDRIMLDYGSPKARAVDRATAAELRAWRDEGQFPPGTMGPKVDAALEFLARGGARVVVTSDDLIDAGIRGEAGTQIAR